MKSVVLDSSALLCWLTEEPGMNMVDVCIKNACISTVNRAEVVAKLFERKSSLNKVAKHMADCDLAGLKIISFTKVQADVSGILRPLTKKRGLSLGDRACIALAEQLKVPILTTDKAWKLIKEINVPVIVIR